MKFLRLLLILALVTGIHLSGAEPALPYRIISFHKGKADLALIRLAKEAGFNGVQIQTERGTEGPVADFADYNQRTKLIETCHGLGMKVSLWIHELNEIPPELFRKRSKGETLKPGEIEINFGTYSQGDLRIIDVSDQRLWDLINERYERFLTKLIPDIDALVLTVTETQLWATHPELLKPLVEHLYRICSKHGKELHLRIFVWRPEELDHVLATMATLPKDVVVMSKCTPQDWHLRSIDSVDLGRVGGRTQIEEWDAAGEYFGRNKLVNAMPDLLLRQLRHGREQGISGICVRVDRDNDSILGRPSEVNLWALGMGASGQTSDPALVWKTWADRRYGQQAGAAVIPALISSSRVVAETLYTDRFSFFDPRKAPQGPDQPDAFSHRANPHYWDPTLRPLHKRLLAGDPAEIARIAADKQEALSLADAALEALDRATPLLKPVDAAQLRTGLVTNRGQLAWRSAMQLSYLRLRRMKNADATKKKALEAQIRQDLERIGDVIARAPAEAVTDEKQAMAWISAMKQQLSTP